MALRWSVSQRLVCLVALIVVFSLFPLAGRSMAQVGGTGSIIGQVADESGGVLPGVTVTAKSPALQVPEVTSVSDDRGEYRLTPLPIGTYTVEYGLAGFQTIRREGIRLSVGFTAKVDVQMKVGALQETVTVSGAAPVLDVTSTSTTTQLTRETLELLPTSRSSFNALMIQAPTARPDIDVGGSSFNESPGFYAMGQLAESWQGIENIVMASPASNQSGNYVDYNTFEEATVEVIGHPAEIPTRGIAINTVIKSGGNDFHGSLFYGGTSHVLQSVNIDSELRRQGIAEGDSLDLRDDVSAELGGRIVRNKLWFYVSWRQRRQHDGILQCFKPDGSGCTNFERARFVTPKVTYQLNASNKFIAFAQPNWRLAERGGSRIATWDTRTERRGHDGAWKGEWQGVKGKSLVMSFLYGSWWLRSGDYDIGQAERPAATDRVTTESWGASTATGQRNNQDRVQAKGNVSWYKPNWFFGNHEFEAGVERQWAHADRDQLARGPKIGNYQLLFRSGMADQISIINTPVFPRVPIRFLHVYGQDSWTIARRLTLNLGLRFGRDNGYIDEQCREAAEAPGNVIFPAQCFPRNQGAIYNNLAPRLRASYDITGDGKTVVKGGWGRYYHMRNTDELLIANRNTISNATYRWRDLNTNRDYNPGEVNLDPNGPDFLQVTLRGIGGQLGNGVINPDEKQRWNDEYMLQFERELRANLSVRVTGVYSQAKNQWRLDNPLRPYGAYNIPIRNADPGPDGTVGTGDDPGTFVTYYDYPAAVAGLRFQQPMVVNDSTANQTYKTIEGAAVRRLSNRWQFRASYSATKKHIPLVPNSGSATTGFFSSLDPNAEIFSVDNTWEWTFRAGGSYLLPRGVLGSVNFDHRSGDVWARTALLRGGAQIPTITVKVEPIGSRRLDNINILDLRLEKRFSLRSGEQLAVRFNVFNSLNSNAVRALVQQSGPNFGQATTILRPRIVEFSTSYSF